MSALPAFADSLTANPNDGVSLPSELPPSPSFITSDESHQVPPHDPEYYFEDELVVFLVSLTYIRFAVYCGVES